MQGEAGRELGAGAELSVLVTASQRVLAKITHGAGWRGRSSPRWPRSRRRCATISDGLRVNTVCA
jgi:hypothetical protein